MLLGLKQNTLHLIFSLSGKLLSHLSSVFKNDQLAELNYTTTRPFRNSVYVIHAIFARDISISVCARVCVCA